MRIIGGSFRGRRLSSLGKGDTAAHLRPTADRVRESLFNILAGYGHPQQECHVLDLFAGTGALGLEALSRGAGGVTFVENGRPAQKLLSENIALCRAEAECTVLSLDARRLGAAKLAPAELVFLDPPYAKGLGEQALAAALKGGWLADDALVVWEESAPVNPPDGLHLQDERRYGDTVIRIFQRN